MIVRVWGVGPPSPYAPEGGLRLRGGYAYGVGEE